VIPYDVIPVISAPSNVGLPESPAAEFTSSVPNPSCGITKKKSNASFATSPLSKSY